MPLTDGELSIGRDEANSICLSDRNVSRQHARLTTKNGHVFVENVAATYGTRFNNLLLRERAEMREGDVVQVGDYVLELVSDDGKKRDTALVDGSSKPVPAPPAATASSAASASKAKTPEGATAIVNLADIASMLKQEPAGATSTIPEAAQPRLVVESDNLRGLELRLSKTPIVVGRVTENADLVIDHRSISKEHARFTRQGDGVWQVLDLASANGLKVNGEPYSKCEIRSGDRIELGHVTLRFLGAGAKAPAAEPARSSGGKSNTLLVVAIGAVVLVAGAVVAFLVARGGKDAPAADDPAVQAAAPKAGTETGTEPGTEQAAVAPAGADPTDSVRQADKLAQAGMLPEALAVLKKAQEDNPGNAQVDLKVKQLEIEIGHKDKLAEAEGKLDADPEGALELATDVKGQLKAGSPLLENADKIIDSAKAAIAEKRKAAAKAVEAAPKPPVVKEKPVVQPAPKAEPRQEPKAVVVKPEPKAEPKPEPKPEPAPTAAKSGAELYKEGRNAMLAGNSDGAVDLFKQAVKAGYGKAHGQLARVYFQRNDKGKCAQHAKSYLDRYPDAGDAPQIQGMLEKCSN